MIVCWLAKIGPVAALAPAPCGGPPIDDRLLARKDLIAQRIDTKRVRDAIGTRVAVLIAVIGVLVPALDRCSKSKPHSPLLRLGGIEAVDGIFRKPYSGRRGGEP
jgi:hypothetical protein